MDFDDPASFPVCSSELPEAAGNCIIGSDKYTAYKYHNKIYTYRVVKNEAITDFTERWVATTQAEHEQVIRQLIIKHLGVQDV